MLVASKIRFSYEEEIITKFLRIKYKYDATRIFNDNPEYKWNINKEKKLLKKINMTGDISQKEGSGRHISVPTEKNNDLVN